MPRAAYDKKIKEQARKLFLLEGKTFTEIAKLLKVRKRQTIARWALEGEWDAKRTSMERKSNELAEEKLVEKLAKDKAEYRNENLKLLDFQKGIYIRVNQVINQSITTNPHTALLDTTTSALRAATQGMVTVIKQQDDMLFNRNKVDLQGEMTVHADTLYKAVIDQLQSEPTNNSG